MAMIPVLLTCLGLYSFFALATAFRPNVVLVLRVAMAFALFSGQIIFLEFFSGCAGLLLPSVIIPCSVLTSMLALRMACARGWQIDMRGHAVALFRITRALFSGQPVLLVLYAAVVLAITWIFAAGFLLPPRAVDDLTYHLPPIYQYIVKGTIVPLPVDLHSFYANPMNAELLYAWPVLLTGNAGLANWGPLLIGIFGLVFCYGIGRQAGLLRVWAAAASGLFFLAPVVMAQSGAAYNDLAMLVFHLAAALLIFYFLKTGDKMFFYFSGLLSGILLGMKYSAPLFVLFLNIVLLFSRPLIKKMDWAFYLALFFPGAVLWCLRNYIFIGKPFYPLDIFAPGWGFMSGDMFGRSFLDLLAMKFHLLYLHDVGNFLLHGGFGIFFWKIIFFVLLLKMISEFIIFFEDRSLPRLFLWVQPALGILILIFHPIEAFQYNVRCAIILVPFGLIALCSFFQSWATRSHGFRRLIDLFIVISICYGLCAMAFMKMPRFNIIPVLQDMAGGTFTSKFYYLNDHICMPRTFLIWDFLDHFSLSLGKSLKVCAFASGTNYIWAAPSFGSRLQNRVFEFEPQDDQLADAYIFDLAHADERGHSNPFSKQQLLDQGFVQVVMTPDAALLISCKLLKGDAARTLVERWCSLRSRDGVKCY